MTRSTCTVSDCEKTVKGHGHCGMHYERLRRTGSLELSPRRGRIKLDRGYVLIKDASHPLAQVNGWVYEHRVVAFSTFGPGVQECGWCGIALEWGRDLHVDHLNHDRADNVPENLLVSCRPCNTARKKDGDPARWARILAERLVLRAHCAEVERREAQLLERLADGSAQRRAA